jgi:protein-disulfide isomerase
MWNIVKRTGDVLIAVSCLMMIAVGAVRLHDRFLVGAQPQAAGAGVPVEPVKDLLIRNIDQATIKGGKAAKIALIEFSDFQCPFCGQFARDTYPQIEREFIKSGEIAYVFFNLPLEQVHPHALRASEAVECAGRQQKFWDMHDRLFKNQSMLDRSALLEHAGALGLTVPDFEMCMAGSTVARIRAQMSEAKALNVTGTPTLFVGVLESAAQARALFRIGGAARYDVIAKVLRDTIASKLASVR